MKFFKKKSEKKVSEPQQLENLVGEEFKKGHLPINQVDRLKCIYYKKFQKENIGLYRSNPVEFWHKASDYVERKLRSEYNKTK